MPSYIYSQLTVMTQTQREMYHVIPLFEHLSDESGIECRRIIYSNLLDPFQLLYYLEFSISCSYFLLMKSSLCFLLLLSRKFEKLKVNEEWKDKDAVLMIQRLIHV